MIVQENAMKQYPSLDLCLTLLDMNGKTVKRFGHPSRYEISDFELSTTHIELTPVDSIIVYHSPEISRVAAKRLSREMLPLTL